MSESPEKPSQQSPQELLESLQHEAVRHNQLLIKLTETVATQAHDIKRMRRVIVMIGWLIIIGSALGIIVWFLNVLYYY
jgi:membrane-associated HD superfamily phosphohydrolase